MWTEGGSDGSTIGSMGCGCERQLWLVLVLCVLHNPRLLRSRLQDGRQCLLRAAPPAAAPPAARPPGRRSWRVRANDWRSSIAEDVQCYHIHVS